MTHTPYRPEIERIAALHRLDADVVEAMVIQESGGNTYAYKSEGHYRYLWDVKAWKPFRRLTAEEIASEAAPRDFFALAGHRDQEWWAQQASWGLMQIMGAVARERGFRGAFLTELVNPTLNLDLGCRHFAGLLKWARGDQWQAVAAYNGGMGNWRGVQPQAHVAKVQRFYARLRKAAA